MLGAAVFFLLLATATPQSGIPIITPNNGTIFGFHLTNFIVRFIGIRYAQPPLGELRFKKPVKEVTQSPTPNSYSEQANHKPACPQYLDPPYPWRDDGETRSEDCLFLNIWTQLPALESPYYKKKTKVKGQRIKRPVKVYVHGGGWFEGGGTGLAYYSGVDEAEDSNYLKSNQDGHVVVTLNYRLGAFGFLSSGTDDAPGNVGIFDIAMALEWVFDNIFYFGGDPKQVTVNGQDGGAIAVSLLLASGMEFKEKFKVVLDGGNMLSLKALPGVDSDGDAYDNNLRLTDGLARVVGCEGSVKEDPAAVIECLRGVEEAKIVKAMQCISKTGPPNVFLPQIKGTHQLFKYNPYEGLAKNPNATSLDTLVSFTSDEGSHLLTTKYPSVFGYFGENDTLLSGPCAKIAARKILKNFPSSAVNQMLGNLDKCPSSCNRKKVIKAIGDAYFVCPQVFYLEALKTSKGMNKTYMLEKQEIGPWNPWAEWMGSVHFNNAQFDFYKRKNVLVIGNMKQGFKTYSYTDQQMAAIKNYHELLFSFMNGTTLSIDEFTVENPAYAVVDPNGTISSDGKTNFHGRNCDILRPFFQYKE